MLAEVLIFVPSVARFRADYLQARLERAQIASLALLGNDMLDAELETELLTNAGVFNVVLVRDQSRQLMLSSPVPAQSTRTYDMRDAGALTLIRDAMMCLVGNDGEVIRVVGSPVRDGGTLIEVTMDNGELRAAMIEYGLNILWLSLVISVITASLLFFAVRRLLVMPIRNLVSVMKGYAAAPEDARRVIEPKATVIELNEAERVLKDLQTQLTGSLRQRQRLAQLGSAVAKISHDLRNILTTAQLFADGMESSEDPRVKRAAPKLVNSISRAVALCEGTLAFGKSEEPPPALAWFDMDTLVEDVFEGERLAAQDAPIEFKSDLPVAMQVRADPEQFFRILTNIVRNARQAIAASHQPGSICVVGLENNDSWALRVTDTGPGLPPKAREHLFKPFQGGIRKGGTGLGLAIASELVRGHGGILALERSDDEGTVFLITLPKTPVHFEEAAE